MDLIYFVILVSLASIAFAVWKYYWVTKKDPGTPRIRKIADIIHQGAMAFLKKEYEIMMIFVAILALILYFFINSLMSLTFVLGSIVSALAGNIGMRIATKGNSRTAYASKESINKGLNIAFSSGSVMGMIVVGFGLLSISVLYIILKDPTILFGFGFGASFVALFARVGGGIFTKAADVGADLVGKVEKNIPEDDPRNPAVIADQVGDNVGDVAGMGADLFESYVDSIIAAMILGAAIVTIGFSERYIILPLMIAALGIISSIIGSFFVKTKRKTHLEIALDEGVISATAIVIIGSYFLIRYLLNDMGVFYAVISGLIAGVIIGISTDYFTSSHRRPAISIAEAAKTGAGTDVIEGLSVGMLSTVIPVLAVCAAVLSAYYFTSPNGLYGVAIAAVGMLSTLGITLATDTYGPVADNAAGIAEMAHMGKKIIDRDERLDAIGNTTAAIGKGFAISSAALTALALFASYIKVANITIIDIVDPKVIVGIFIGSAFPFLFSALTIKAVCLSAEHVVDEVRRQFKTIKGLMSGTAKPHYNQCIRITTGGALRNLALPSIIVIVVPILVGKFLGLAALGGLLVGVTVTGFLMAVFMSNAGGAWDNAKKYVEEGKFGGKGSAVYKATVVGDTVGDPFKDCSGPSINILIKLVSIVALVFMPLFL